MFSHSVYATQSSEYIETLLSSEEGRSVRVVSKKEHLEECKQIFGDKYIDSIAYGVGYMKILHEKKTKISYICLLGKDNKPIWGNVIPR